MASGFPILLGAQKLWQPPSLGSDLAVWFDAADDSTITLNGTTVSLWKDKSGNGRDASQSTAANQPTYTANGISNKPVLTFDGANDYMVSAAGSYGPNISISAVASQTSGNDFRRLVNVGTADTYGFFGTGGTAQTFFATFFGDGVTWNDTSANTPNISMIGNNSVIGVVNGANVATPYVDGTAQNTKNGAMTAATGLIIGGDPNLSGQFWLGPVGEIVITNDALATSDRQKLEGYLAWKWGLQGKLPNTHPYKNFPPLG